jgi:predicted transcriptional regulator
MIPLQPVSVKFTDDERARLKALATALGWTESQVVRDSVAAIIYLVQHPNSEIVPKIIGMARQAMEHEENPLLLQQHMKQIHRAGTP